MPGLLGPDRAGRASPAVAVSSAILRRRRRRVFVCALPQRQVEADAVPPAIPLLANWTACPHFWTHSHPRRPPAPEAAPAPAAPLSSEIARKQVLRVAGQTRLSRVRATA